MKAIVPIDPSNPRPIWRQIEKSIRNMTLAGLGLAGALAFAALAQRWIAIGPQDLDRWSFAAVSPGQAWIALAGPVPGPREHGASFLLQVGSRRSVRARFARGAEDTLPLAFSADGRRAVWAEDQDREGASPGVLVSVALDRPGAVPVRTPIMERAPPVKLALSPVVLRSCVPRYSESDSIREQPCGVAAVGLADAEIRQQARHPAGGHG